MPTRIGFDSIKNTAANSRFGKKMADVPGATQYEVQFFAKPRTLCVILQR
jgi:hypothetical protein